MKYLWKFPVHREAFKKEAQNTQSFLGFVNMLINDSIYLLDESLAKLAKIRSTQLEMASPDWVTRHNVVSYAAQMTIAPLILTRLYYRMSAQNWNKNTCDQNGSSGPTCCWRTKQCACSTTWRVIVPRTSSTTLIW